MWTGSLCVHTFLQQNRLFGQAEMDHVANALVLLCKLRCVCFFIDIVCTLRIPLNTWGITRSQYWQFLGVSIGL